MSKTRLTAAQAAVRWLAAQYIDLGGEETPYFKGVWAIFGHGNVAGLGEALYAERNNLPTYRAHNEQAMAHAAVAYAKHMRRRRAMVCTTSIGPGATNMVTAAALAHVSRLPVLLMPGDVFANRRPDPVLQQLEDFEDGTVSANDCFRPVSRYFDRIVRPEQLLTALPHALAIMIDPASCGPVTLAFCQDVQAEAYEWPSAFFERRLWTVRRSPADPHEIGGLLARLKAAKRPLIVCGGGVLYSKAETALSDFVLTRGVPVAETQAGKGALAWDHPLLLGAIGVTGSAPANAAAAEADLIIGLGTRLQDFTTGSRALFAHADQMLVQVNIAPFDAYKHGAEPVVGDARAVLSALNVDLGDWRASPEWARRASAALGAWNDTVDTAMATSDVERPSDAHVIGAVWRTIEEDAIVVAAAGGLPGELHKLWRTRSSGGYHVEYGYSCMGYEIAGALGVKLAAPDRQVVVMVGDGSYLMLNSEIATSVMANLKLLIVLLDNGGFGCIGRLQEGTGGAPFNNLLDRSQGPQIDFAAHARSLGAYAEKVSSIVALEAAMRRASAAERTYVVVIETDPNLTTDAGGAWWDVAVPEVSTRAEVRAARSGYEAKTKTYGDGA